MEKQLGYPLQCLAAFFLGWNIKLINNMWACIVGHKVIHAPKNLWQGCLISKKIRYIRLTSLFYEGKHVGIMDTNNLVVLGCATLCTLFKKGANFRGF